MPGVNHAQIAPALPVLAKLVYSLDDEVLIRRRAGDVHDDHHIPTTEGVQDLVGAGEALKALPLTSRLGGKENTNRALSWAQTLEVFLLIPRLLAAACISSHACSERENGLCIRSAAEPEKDDLAKSR